MTGALRRDVDMTGDGQDDEVYNGVLTFDGVGSVVARYDWSLVSGREGFFPLNRCLNQIGFRKVTIVPASFPAEPVPVSVSPFQGAPAAGFRVTHEAIFPDRFVDPPSGRRSR